MTVLFVAFGGALGAPLRYLIDRGCRAWLGSGFPWGTLAANGLASGLLGLVTVLTLPEPWLEFVATGFLGALSTYSTFSYETLRLARGGERWRAVANAAGSIVVGLGAAVAGGALARLLGA